MSLPWQKIRDLEAQIRALPGTEAEVAGGRDHGRIVGAQTRRWAQHRQLRALFNGMQERAIGGDATAERQAGRAKGLGGGGGLGREYVDDSCLKAGGQIGDGQLRAAFIGCGLLGVNAERLDLVANGSLQAAE